MSILNLLGGGEDARSVCSKRYYLGKHQKEIKFRLAGTAAKQKHHCRVQLCLRAKRDCLARFISFFIKNIYPIIRLLGRVFIFI